MHSLAVRFVSTFFAILCSALSLCGADADERWDSRFGSVAEGYPCNPGETPQLALFHGKLHCSGKTVSFWNGKTWEVIGRPEGTTWHLVASSNRLYVAGAFASISGVAARNVAAWDGTNWMALDAKNNAALGGRISAIGLNRAGVPFISSQPPDYQRSAKSSVWNWSGAKWERVGDELRTGTVCEVRKIAAGRSNVFAVLYYEAPNVESGYGDRLFELVNGNWRLFRQQPVHYGIHCIAIGKDDQPIVGGEMYMNPSLTNLAQWNGKAWEPVGGGVKGYPLTLATDDDALIVAGNFSSAGDVASRGIARWNGNKWQGFAGGFSGGGVMYATGEKECVAIDMTSIGCIALDGERLFVSGSFTRAGDSGATGLAVWNGKEWQSLNSTTHQGVNGKIHSLVAIGTSLFAVGEFTGAGGLAVDGVARWDGQRWETLRAPFRVASQSRATTDGTNLFVTSGAPDAHLFEWNFSSWKSHGSTGTDWARGVAVHNGQMFVGGYGICQISNGVAAELPGSPQMRSGSIDAIAFGPDDRVYAGGNFQAKLTTRRLRRISVFEEQGGQPGESFSPFHQTSNFAIWNGTAWSDPLGGVGQYSDRVRAIVPRGSNVFVGGNFLNAGRVAVRGLALWDGKQWHDVGGGVTGDGEYAGNYWNVSAIAFHGNDLYVAGHFSQAGGIRASNIAKWDGQRWTALGSGINGRVNALAVVGNQLCAGGEFSTAGKHPSSNFACWRIE